MNGASGVSVRQVVRDSAPRPARKDDSVPAVHRSQCATAQNAKPTYNTETATNTYALVRSCVPVGDYTIAFYIFSITQW